MIWPSILWSTLAHHSEAADPNLLEWIKDRLDHILNLGPWTIVAALALLILLIPVSVVAMYWIQQRRRPGLNRRLTDGKES